jgi:hypothetical protein
MSGCIYCGLEAYNVMEVRYARTLKRGSTGYVPDEDAPREVIGRGYYICDGCVALLDYHVQHHLDAGKHALFNVLSTAYHTLVVWVAVAVGSLAGTASLFVRRDFLNLGVALAFAALVAWFVRASVHSQYFGRWKAERSKPHLPKNSLGGFTDLRDRANPELSVYLPVRFEDSIKMLAKQGSPPLRCLGPNGEPWGQGPETNFLGRGVNEDYRLVWSSGRLWPLTQILPPAGTDWRAPTPPPITEVEIASATVLSAGSFAALALAPGVPLWAGVLVALVMWPIGFVIGRQGRALYEQGQGEKSTRPVL